MSSGLAQRLIFVIAFLMGYVAGHGGPTEGLLQNKHIINKRQEVDPYLARAGPPMDESDRETCKTIQFQELKPGVHLSGVRFPWRVALECCQLKGWTLLSNSLRHADVLSRVVPIRDDYDRMPWVGTNEILKEGIYEWSSGELIIRTRPPWRTNEPSKGNDRGHCGQADRDGHLNNLPCNHQKLFICEDLPPSGGVDPIAEDVEICRTLKFEDNGSKFIKQKGALANTLVNRPAAKACCERRGWKLASLRDLTSLEEEELAELLYTPEVSFWTSGKMDEASNIYHWDENNKETIYQDFSLWAPNAPQTLFIGRGCVRVTKNQGNTVSIRDVSCNLKGPILCQDPNDHCCVATDTAKIVSKSGPIQFEFRSDVSTGDKMELGLSLMRHLSPSKSTLLDWGSVWQKYFIERSGNGPVEFDEKYVAGPPQDKACTTSFFAYFEYVASCLETVVAYVEPVVVTPENVTSFCVTPKNCAVSPCKACDCWVLLATHETKERPPAGSKLARDDDPGSIPCFVFEPELDHNDFTNALLAREFITTLNPSPSTGVDWAAYYANVTSGVAPEDYEVRKGDVPRGSFLNIYEAEGTCGKFKTTIPVYKKVLFKTGDTQGNCAIAQEENVPLDGC